jgi:hypothetical protein|tara:strand:- start:252 stop:695 length:444 start_codon:yes stop_codon:yes gene_type:complete
MKMISPWYYEGRPFEPPENFSSDDYYGFVYCITNRGTDRKYIGKKFFWSKKTLPITKTRKRRKRLLVESDWRDYFGSNKHLNEEREKVGEDTYFREILHLCKSKGECAYLEAKEQFDREVLGSDKYYNGIINVRIGAKSVKNLFTND